MKSDQLVSLLAIAGLACASAAGQERPASSAQAPARITTNQSTVRQTPPSDFGTVMRRGADLQRQVDAEVAGTSAAAAVVGNGLAATELRELDAACAALAASPDDANAKRRLEQWLTAHKGRDPAAIARFCLAPRYRALQSDLQRDLGNLRAAAPGEDQQAASLRLQMVMDRQSKMMATLSNLLKKMSDTAQSITQNLK